jgi:hypothetical protein
MSIEAIPHKPSSKPSLQTFVVVAEKEMSSTLHEITALFNKYSLYCYGNQVQQLACCCMHFFSGKIYKVFHRTLQDEAFTSLNIKFLFNDVNFFKA